MDPAPPSPSPFGKEALAAAVHETLAAADIPAHHGVAAIVDTKGAHIGFATRVGDGWNLDLDAGYRWDASEHGLAGSIQIAKSW